MTRAGLSREDVEVDVGALADVAGHDAADEPGPKGPEQAHQVQGVEAHVREGVRVRCSPSWMRAKSWICSRISALEGRSAGLTPAAKTLGGLAFGGEVFGLHAPYMSRAASRAIA